MNEDMVFVDGEIKTVSKEIEEFLESMISSIASYNKQLKHVQQLGIQDELIRAKLGNLSTLLTSYKSTLTEILDKFQRDRNGFLSDLDKNDMFSFPFGGIEDIDALLNLFS